MELCSSIKLRDAINALTVLVELAFLRSTGAVCEY
jgi:hypothetical protein